MTNNEIETLKESLASEYITPDYKIFSLFDQDGLDVRADNTANYSEGLENYYLIKQATVDNRHFTAIYVCESGDPRNGYYDELFAFETDHDSNCVIDCNPEPYLTFAY